MKKFKVKTLLVWQYKKRNDNKNFHSSTKLIASDSNLDEAFKSMYPSIMTKAKNSISEDCTVIESILKYSIKIFECV